MLGLARSLQRNQIPVMRLFEFENNIDINDGLAVLKLTDHNSVAT